MKRLSFFLSFLLLSFLSFSQKYLDSKGAIRPLGKYPIVNSDDVKGGIHKVADLTERNALPVSYQDTGMLVYVRSIKKTYQLQDSATILIWAVFGDGKLTKVNANTYLIGTDTLAIPVAITDTSNLHRQDSLLNVKVSANTTAIASNSAAIAGIKQVTGFSKNVTRDSIILTTMDGNNVSQRFAVKDSVGTSGGGGTPAGNKEDIFSVVPYSTTLRFGTNKESLPHMQAGAETFTLATDSQLIGKKIKLTIIGDGTSLTFPSQVIWKFNRLPQTDETNDFVFTFRADGNIDGEVSTRNQNYANLMYVYATSFLTYAGYAIEYVYVYNDSPAYISLGTTAGGTDIINNQYCAAGVKCLGVHVSFDTPTYIYRTGGNANTYLKLPNPSLNNN